MIRKDIEMKSEVRDKMRNGVGKVHVKHLFAPDEITAKTRLCALLTLPPASSIGLHQHEGEDELYYILHGTGVIDDGSNQTPVSPGDAILTGNGESHSVTNTGSDNLDILAVIMKYS